MKTDKKTLAKIADLEAKWKRAVADYHNLEKRVTKEQAEFIKFANASLISRLLGIIDNLERAALHLKDDGLKLIIGELKDILKSEGVTEIDATNKPFDAHTMEVVDTLPGTSNQVLEVITKGYQLNNKVLRPTRVKVGK